jgi:hypothetical protein
VTPPGASSDTLTAASDLAQSLGYADGSAPSVSPGGTYGIFIGTIAELTPYVSGLAAAVASWGSDSHGYLTLAGTLVLTGRNARGVYAAVGALMRIGLGIRYLSTTAEWRVTTRPILQTEPFPADSGELTIRFPIFSQPGGVFASDAPGATEDSGLQPQWARNTGGLSRGHAAFGHAYAAMIDKYPTEFAANPHWRPVEVVAGDTDAKLCTYEAGLQHQAYLYGVSTIVSTPDREVVSMSTSDGDLGWASVCAGTGEEATKSVSDRALKLANSVQAELRANGYTQRVSLLVYSSTSPAPTVEVPDPSLLLVWATAYMKDGLSALQVLQGWADAYADPTQIYHAPYEYPTVYPLDHDLPGKGRTWKRSELVETIGNLNTGIGTTAGWTGESSAERVRSGKWYAALNSIQVGDNPLTVWDTWETVAFPSATSAALSYYAALESGAPVSTDLVNKLCTRALALMNALVSAGASSDEYERALDLARYAHWLSLWRSFLSNQAGNTYDKWLQWSFRCRTRDVSTLAGPYQDGTYATYRKAAAAIHSLSDLHQNAPPWSDLSLPLDTEIRTLLATDIANNPLIPFETKDFSTDYVWVTGLTHADTVRGDFVEETHDATGEGAFWYRGSTTLILSLKGGVVHTDKGPSNLRIYESSSQVEVYNVSIPADRITRTTAPGNGLYPQPTNIVAQNIYRIEVLQGGGITWDWQDSDQIAWVPSDEYPLFTASASGYFYVPRGETVIGFYAQGGNVKFFSADNVQAAPTFTPHKEYLSFPVPLDADGNPKDGQVYKVEGYNGAFRLMRTPNIIARRPAAIPIPREVQEADGLVLADSTPPPTRDYTPIVYGTDLEPPTTPFALKGGHADYTYFGNTGTLFYLYGTGATILVNITGGIVVAKTTPSIIEVRDTSAGDALITTFTVPADQTAHSYAIPTTAGHLYKLVMTSVGAACDVDWSTVGVNLVAPMVGPDQLHSPFTATYSGHFYCPNGVTSIGFWAQSGLIKIYDGSTLLGSVSAAGGYYSIPTNGHTHRTLEFTGASGRLLFETVPPYFAYDASRLMIPHAVKVTDGL